MSEIELAPKKLSLLGDLEIAGNLTVLGFTLPADVTFDQYEAIGKLFGTAHEALKFAIGDWLLEGQRVFGDDVYQATEATGISKASLMQYTRVAERIPMDRRNGLLTWSHHRAVVALEPEEQDIWLNRAAESGWSKTQLEEHLREQREVTEEPVKVRHFTGYVIEVVCDAAEALYLSKEQLAAGGWKIPEEQMAALGAAFGEAVE